MYRGKSGQVGTGTQMMTSTEPWFPLGMSTRFLEKTLEAAVTIMDWKELTSNQKDELVEEHMRREAEKKAAQSNINEDQPKDDSPESSPAIKADPKAVKEHPTL